jgi:predicted TIM-barrel fold metal-dependent hydrolase
VGESRVRVGLRKRGSATRELAVIDCDVHQNFDHVQDLVPWLDPAFRDYVVHGGYGGYSLPNYPWLHPSGFMRDDARPADGGVPGSDYELLRQQLLDAFDVEFAILTGEEILSVSAVPHAQLASALATAYNRWLVEEWLPRDPRLKGSLVIAPQDAPSAVQEIQRVGKHPDVVQAIVSCGSAAAYGDPRYHPIWAACAELGLPVAMHVGAEGLGANAPPTATGYPSYYLEWHTLLPTTAMSHLVSLVAQGVFERFPGFRVVVVEAGVAWLPGVLWRLDANWRALRAETPWVKELPSETVRRRVRLTTQPLEQPQAVDQLSGVLGAIEGLEEMLMFATDYPHWDFDEPEQVARRLPAAWRDRVMSENARDFYGLRGEEDVRDAEIGTLSAQPGTHAREFER